MRDRSITELTSSIDRRELVVVCGTGTSLALTDATIPALSWRGLIRNGFAYGSEKGRISKDRLAVWEQLISSDDLDDLLAAAEFLGAKLGAPAGDMYGRWLQRTFANIAPANDAMKAALARLQALGVPICTLNYDTLLESVSGLPTITMGETAKVLDWMKRPDAGILHLHGVWSLPSSCVLGIRDYEATVSDEARGLIQRSLATYRRLLFIGCGDTFGDPNLRSLVGWLRRTMGAAVPQHYALVRESEIGERNADPTWQGFVDPVGFGVKHDELAAFLTERLLRTAPEPARVRSSRSRVSTAGAIAVRNEELLRHYRAFLLRDCGQMTIEGVRADMDTAQRKFDLERLFVPLQLLATPPELPMSDAKRAEKLHAWHEKHGSPREFSDVFRSNKSIALLALPGGGKTLLLKRLAVAYADPSRRLASEDGLPELSVTPVMIRCREWREHLHRPIGSLLDHLHEIAGDVSLTGLSSALLPLFRSGRVLLLIDGIDEIHDDSLRSTFVENLERFLEEHKGTRIVVTSRQAGFSLVAPTIARFCTRWGVAPLSETAIRLLCNHWHVLMGGESPESIAESQETAGTLLRTAALRRLAENPLLLTMLLVVKHGAGRLPPDRVTLYERAVEVLLDTWNIKGHSPLNIKEAEPQLAYVALEMMRRGKQTATEAELLELFEEARENVSQIRRYATGTPYEFLKRVELRSSLLIEGGLQADRGRVVPFYQFRHLTFQEYLAGVAVAHGHYREYTRSDTVLGPLNATLDADEWKEVIPMAAVLARKQAEPLLAELVRRAKVLCGEFAEGSEEKRRQLLGATYPGSLPAPVGRLLQCLVEEAEATADTLTSALQSIAFFARGCTSSNDWEALIRGPYGEEFYHQAWLLFDREPTSQLLGMESTCRRAAGGRTRVNCVYNPDCIVAEIRSMLSSTNREVIARGLFAISDIGMGPARTRESEIPAQFMDLVPLIEKQLCSDDRAIRYAAVMAGTLLQYHLGSDEYLGTASFWDRMLEIWLNDPDSPDGAFAGYGIGMQFGRGRDEWSPRLTSEQIKVIRNREKTMGKREQFLPEIVVAFHSRTVWTDTEIARLLQKHHHFQFRAHWHDGGNNGDTTRRRLVSQMTTEKVATPRSNRSNNKRARRRN